MSLRQMRCLAFLFAFWALVAAGCRDSTGGRDKVTLGQATRTAATLSLYVGQGAAVTPETGDTTSSTYSGDPVISSPAVAFVGIETITAYTPEGASQDFHIYRFRAAAPGRAVVTIRYADGKAAVQDTIEVQAAVAHGAFTQLSTGFFLSTCGLTAAGAAFCWGDNTEGMLGAGPVTGPVHELADPVYDAPMPVDARLVFSGISVGGSHVCGVTTGGAAYCWGANNNGQLGNGDTAPSPRPVAVAGGLTFRAVSAGVNHTCGLTTTGAIYCWGNNYDAELGNPGAPLYPNSSPLRVLSDSSFVAVGAGYQYSCGLTASGAAYCWGLGRYGSLGAGDTISSPVPVPVAGGLRFAALSAGFHACALDYAGAAYCWGANSEGELGNGTTGQADRPVAVSGGLAFATISAGEWATCGVTLGGAAYCWGFNGFGQLGNAAIAITGNPHPAPVPVGGGSSFSAISTGYLHTCGVATQGAAYCWGDNSEGELGDGSATLHPTPVRVFGQ